MAKSRILRGDAKPSEIPEKNDLYTYSNKNSTLDGCIGLTTDVGSEETRAVILWPPDMLGCERVLDNDLLEPFNGVLELTGHDGVQLTYAWM